MPRKNRMKRGKTPIQLVALEQLIPMNKRHTPANRKNQKENKHQTEKPVYFWHAAPGYLEPVAEET